jgi:hypothetical protein
MSYKNQAMYSLYILEMYRTYTYMYCTDDVGACLDTSLWKGLPHCNYCWLIFEIIPTSELTVFSD